MRYFAGVLTCFELSCQLSNQYREISNINENLNNVLKNSIRLFCLGGCVSAIRQRANLCGAALNENHKP